VKGRGAWEPREPPRWWPPRAALASLGVALREHPRHVALAALVAGLLARGGPVAPALAVAALLVAGWWEGRADAPPLVDVTSPSDVNSASSRAPASAAVPVVPDHGSTPDADPPRSPRSRPLTLGLLAAAGVLAGSAVAEERLAALDATALRPAAQAEVRGPVLEPPRARAGGVRAVLVRHGGERVVVRVPARLALPGETAAVAAGGEARDRGDVRGRNSADGRARGALEAGGAELVPGGSLAPGTELVARGRLRALRAHEGFERRRGVHAVLEAHALRATGRWAGTPFDRVRARAEARIASGLAPEQAALARGMVLGQDHALPTDLREAFRTAGLAHLLAASGQNVMLLATLVIALATAAGLGLRGRLAAALVAVALYVPLAGAGASIQRAGVMGAAGLVAALAGRPASRWYALLLAAAATLALQPRASEDPGWQLSFAAVVAILALHAPLRDALVRRRVDRAAAEVAALTTAATLGTAPLLALHFEQVSLVSLPANLLAAPAVAPVMWLGTLAAVVGGDAARLLNALASYPLGYLTWLAETAARVPAASVPLRLPGPLAVAVAYALLVAAALAPAGARRVVPPPVRAALRGREPSPRADVPGGGGAARGASGAPVARLRVVARAVRAARVAAVPAAVVVVAAVVLLTPGAPGPPPGFRLSLLDVGQGDAILVQHGPHAVLVDAGPPGSDLLAHLRRAGVERLDALLVTHASADHEGGAARVLAEVPVGVVLDGSEGLRLPRGTRRLDPRAGQTIRAGPLAIELLWPPPGRPRAEDPNETAVVALVRGGGMTALLTADAESPVTLPLGLPRVDVLKVAHHGSEDAGLPELLARTRPRVALLPVGRNAYGHPHPATLAALRAAVPDVRRTDRDGTIRVEPGLRVSDER